jgi:hypothetical protein
MRNNPQVSIDLNREPNVLKTQLNAALLTLSIGVMSACGLQTDSNQFPHTGNEEAEALMSAAIATKSEVELGRVYYVTTSSLNIRSSDEISGSNRLGMLSLNDTVRIISTDASGDFVEVELIRTSGNITRSERYFLSYKFLSPNPSDLMDLPGRYFMVQNMATEKLRVYERVCADNSCPHKMVLEADMVAGEDDPETRSILGSFRITSWEKFYEDYSRNYPSWYHPDYPATPGPGQSIRAWRANRAMPTVNGRRQGSFRGAFGWYAAKVGPNHSAQWTHGTYGWGHESADFIKKTRGFMANLLLSPRSNGCTRTDNLTVAYLREILPVGTPVVRIYAQEAFLDANLTNYTQAFDTWDYILTTRDARRTNGETSDRDKVMTRGITPEEILEEGTYRINMIPTVTESIPGENLNRYFAIRNPRASKDSGNVYAIPGDAFQGVFYVDAGKVHNYQHPRHEKIRVGGFSNMTVPGFMLYR